MGKTFALILINFALILVIKSNPEENERKFFFSKLEKRNDQRMLEQSKNDKTPKYFLSIIATFKNEAFSIREWVEHHISEGIDHIFLIDNGSDDNYVGKIIDYVVSGKVTIKYEPLRRQSLNMYNYYVEIKQQTEWMMLLDLDEYAYAPEKDQTVKSIMLKQLWSCENKNQKVGRIKFFWKNFASSFYKTQPELVVPNFIYMHNCENKGSACTDAFVPEKDPDYSCFVGSAIGVHWFSFDEVNYCEVSAKPSIVLNHYRCQSVENWMRIKMPKGYLLKFNLDVKGFYEWDMNEYKDYDLVAKKMDIDFYKKLQDYCNALFNREIKKNNNGEYYCACQKGFTDHTNQLDCIPTQTVSQCKPENNREMKPFNNTYVCPCKNNYYDLGFENCVDSATYQTLMSCKSESNKELKYINNKIECVCVNGSISVNNNKCIQPFEMTISNCSSQNIFLFLILIVFALVIFVLIYNYKSHLAEFFKPREDIKQFKVNTAMEEKDLLFR